MICSEKIPLTNDQTRKLQEWMAQEGLLLLLRVMESHSKEEECLALKDAITGKPGKIDIANAHMEAAREWAIASEKVRELREPGKIYYVKLT